MANPLMSGNVGTLFAPGINQILYNELPDLPEEYSQLCQVETSEHQFEQDQVFAGLGLARLKRELVGIEYDQIVQGGSKRYTHDVYALGWAHSLEVMEDDRYAVVRETPRQLARSIRHKVEAVGFAPFNTGFTTTTTADGETLFDTAHPVIDPAKGDITTATQSNYLNPAADLSITAIQNILLMAESQVDEAGMRVTSSPTDLWMAPDLQFLAQKLMGSQFDPDTGNNAINPIAGRLTPHIGHWFTSSTIWFLKAAGVRNNVKFFWRRRPVTMTWDDNEVLGSKHAIHARFSANATDYRGLWAGHS